MPTHPPLPVPHGPRRGDQFAVCIDHLNDKGLGVVQLDLLVGPGRQRLSYPMVVRGALPGEAAVVVVTSRYRRTISARIVDSETSEVADSSGDSTAVSKHRIAPHCGHFGDPFTIGRGCGGCSLQHLALDQQRVEKRARVAHLLAAQGFDPALVKATAPASPAWFYRNKMEFSFGNDRDRRFSLGLHPAGYRYETLALSECHLMSPFVSRFVPEIARWAERAELPAFEPRRNEGLLRTLTIREGKRTGQRLVTLETERGGAPPDDLGARFVAAVTQIAQQLNGAVDSIHWLQRDAERGRKTTWTAQHLFGNTELAEKLQLPNGRTLTFSIGPRAFFQPSTLGAEAIYTEVIAQSSLQPSTLQSGLRDGAAQTVLDLYCGTGTIGLCLAPWAERVIGIELNEEAAHNARRNAERNGITNIELHCGDAAKVLQELALPSAGIDVVVVDPPRAGLNGKAIEQIVRLAPKRLVYVACSPKSLARDAALLRDRGYGLTTVQPIDQFPQTGHIECVATLLRLPVT